MRTCLDCELAWATDARNIAIKYHPHNGYGGVDALISLTKDGLLDWHLLYVLDTASRRVQPITATPSFPQTGHVMILGEVAFAPNSRVLLAPWSR